MTVQHVNFYENITEAQLRLRSTTVLYAGVPYMVVSITNHRNDGVFRIYLRPLNVEATKFTPYPSTDNYGPQDPALGHYLDTWLETTDGKASGILRKRMDSKHFEKFRPFPLGMCNYGEYAYYLERQPSRQTLQGLTRNMVVETRIDTGKPIPMPRGSNNVDLQSPAFHSCVMATHPPAKDCLENLLDPEIKNVSVAFNRLFAFCRGPIDMMFLAYKDDIVGVLPKNNLEYVRLGRDFVYLREAVAALGIFNNVM